MEPESQWFGVDRTMSEHKRLERLEPIPSPSQAESQWVEVDRNETHVLWRRRDTGFICFGGLGSDRPTESFAGYDNSRGLAELGRRSYKTNVGTPVYGYIPRDSAEAPKGSSHELAATAAENTGRLTCSSCKAPFQPNAHSGPTTCGYCRHRREVLPVDWRRYPELARNLAAERVQVRKRDERFDPRPGIDDWSDE